MSSQHLAHFSKKDMEAAEKMLRLHLEKIKKHIADEQWSLACRALRALEDECKHTSRIATSLSFQTHNNQPAIRFSRAATTGGLQHG